MSKSQDSSYSLALRSMMKKIEIIEQSQRQLDDCRDQELVKLISKQYNQEIEDVCSILEWLKANIEEWKASLDSTYSLTGKSQTVRDIGQNEPRKNQVSIGP
jgi:hypothetical protein